MYVEDTSVENKSWRQLTNLVIAIAELRWWPCRSRDLAALFRKGLWLEERAQTELVIIDCSDTAARRLDRFPSRRGALHNLKVQRRVLSQCARATTAEKLDAIMHLSRDGAAVTEMLHCDDAARIKPSEVHPQLQLVEVQRYIAAAKRVVEAALRRAKSQRRLPTLETQKSTCAGPALLSVVPAPGRLASAGSDATAHAFRTLPFVRVKERVKTEQRRR